VLRLADLTTVERKHIYGKTEGFLAKNLGFGTADGIRTHDLSRAPRVTPPAD
jgi:hypothetical protein